MRSIISTLLRLLTCMHPGVGNIFPSGELLYSNVLLKFMEGTLMGLGLSGMGHSLGPHD